MGKTLKNKDVLKENTKSSQTSSNQLSEAKSTKENLSCSSVTEPTTKSFDLNMTKQTSQEPFDQNWEGTASLEETDIVLIKLTLEIYQTKPFLQIKRTVYTKLKQVSPLKPHTLFQ